MQMQPFELLNYYLRSPIGSVLGAIIIFLLGYIFALIFGAITRKTLAKFDLNQKLSNQTGTHYDLHSLLGKIVFWFVFVIGISAALNQLNLNAISAPFANMVNHVLLFIPNVLAAVAVGVIGWVVAVFAKKATLTALKKTTLDDRLANDAAVKPMSATIADTVYWLILLLVLTVVLGRLGLDGLFHPLTNMLDKIFAFVPNVLIAGFVFFVGFVVAKIIKGIATGLVSSLNLQSLATRLGMSNQNNLPAIAGSVAFLVVIIPFTIASLDALKIEAISRPATNMLDKILTAMPNVFAAVAVLVITYFVISMIADVIKGLLVSTQIDNLPAKFGFASALGEQTISGIIRSGLVFFAMLFASVAAADLLGFAQIGHIISLFIGFGGQIILGTIILFIGFWLASIVSGVVENAEHGSPLLANIVRTLIIGLVLAMGLKAMGIADSIVNLAFGLTLGAVALAFALAFGLGGRDAAARYLAQLQDKLGVSPAPTSSSTATTTKTTGTTTKAKRTRKSKAQELKLEGDDHKDEPHAQEGQETQEHA